MGDETRERPLFATGQSLPEGKIIHRRVEPPNAKPEDVGRMIRSMFQEHPKHSVYVRMLEDGRLEMIVVEGAVDE